MGKKATSVSEGEGKWGARGREGERKGEEVKGGRMWREWRDGRKRGMRGWKTGKGG